MANLLKAQAIGRRHVLGRRIEEFPTRERLLALVGPRELSELGEAGRRLARPHT